MEKIVRIGKKPTWVSLEPKHRDIINRIIRGQIPGVRAESMAEAMRVSLEFVEKESGEAQEWTPENVPVAQAMLWQIWCLKL